MNKITPFLWFEKDAEEAMKYYVETFNGNPKKKQESKVVEITRYPENGEGPMKGFEGKILNGMFELEGQTFLALDGGPNVFEFSGAISFLVDSESQEEVDYFWNKLSSDPKSEQCGWCKDKYGITWQIVPRQLSELMSDPDHEKAGRVTHAMLQMKKIDIAKLQEAYNNKG